MEIYAQSSKYIAKLITDFQNDKIDKQNLNKNILINAIFSFNYLNKKNKKYNKIKKEQNETYQIFFKKEQEQDEGHKKLVSKIRDRKSKKIVEESIRKDRESLINELGSMPSAKVSAEHTFNSYIPMKDISLSINFELNHKKQKPKKLFLDSNVGITYLNPSSNEKEDKFISVNFIESPFTDDLSFGNNNINDAIEEEEIGETEKETDSNNDENDMFTKITFESDEILFYDERLRKNEKKNNIENWLGNTKDDDIEGDFEEFRQKQSRTEYNVENFFSIFKQDNVSKKELSNYLAKTSKLYDEIAQQDHFHEFNGYLTEKTYKMYIKKMNYSYLILMLLSFFDFEKFANNFEFVEESKTMVVFIKKILLFSGIATSKIYENIVSKASDKKGELNFENYLYCFLPILELPEKYQCYKYRFLLFLVKKSESNKISMDNYRLFCNLIRGKAIYEAETCDDLIGKMIPILKEKYPNDDLDNLNYQHVSIILEFLVNYEYGD